MNENWNKQYLSEIFTLEYGFSLPDSQRSGEGFPVYGSNGIVGKHSSYAVEGSGIIIGRKGSVGVVKWSETSYTPIDTAYYVVKITNVDLRWLYWLLCYLPLKNLDTSTGVPGLNRNDVYKIQWNIPPLHEQRAIADILDTVDEAIQQTEALITKLQRIKAGRLHDLLTRGLDENGQLRDPIAHPEQFHETPLGLLPKAWEVKPANQLCSMIIDCKNRTPPVLSEGYPVIRTPNVRNGRFVTDELVFTDERSYEIWTQRGKPLEGDVLITREAPFGEVCLLPEHLGKACLGQRMMLYRPIETVLHNQYMVFAILSLPLKNHMIAMAGGSTVGHLRVDDIRTLPLPLPELREQILIADDLTAHENIIAAEERHLSKLRRVKQGLMDDLLTGRVRVSDVRLDERLEQA